MTWLSELMAWLASRRPAHYIAIVLVGLILTGELLVHQQLDRNAAVGMLWAGAFVMVGALLGFLFGIPRVLQSRPADGSEPSLSPSTKEEDPGRARLLQNTNLEQVSDWLTKILLGVGLVELRDLPRTLDAAAAAVAAGLGVEPYLKSWASAAIIYFSITGFLAGYVLTRLFLVYEFAQADLRSERASRVLNRQIKKAVEQSSQDARTVPSPQTVSAAQRIGRLDPNDDVVRAKVLELASRYERIRASFAPGPDRTQRMERVVAEMRTLAMAGSFMLEQLTTSESPGQRLAALAFLQVNPRREYLSWLPERFVVETPFVAYHAAVALQAAVRRLDREDLALLGPLIDDAIRARASKPDAGIDTTLANAKQELQQRLEAPRA